MFSLFRPALQKSGKKQDDADTDLKFNSVLQKSEGEESPRALYLIRLKIQKKNVYTCARKNSRKK